MKIYMMMINALCDGDLSTKNEEQAYKHNWRRRTTIGEVVRLYSVQKEGDVSS